MRYDFQHVHILCKQLEPMLDFLSGALGGEIMRRRMIGQNPKPGADVKFRDTIFIVQERDADWQEPDPRARICGYNHIGFLVEDMQAALAELTARPDTSLVIEPYSLGKRQCAFVAGPENLYVEIMQDMV